jgi:hypothetical protein
MLNGYAECHNADPFMLSFTNKYVVLSAVKLNVIMMNVNMLIVIMLNDFMFSVTNKYVMVSVFMLSVAMLNVVAPLNLPGYKGMLVTIQIGAENQYRILSVTHKQSLNKLT